MDDSRTHTGNAPAAAPNGGDKPPAGVDVPTPFPGGASIAFPAFDTGCLITAYGDPPVMEKTLQEARNACREYERLFSRTLPHSDIGRLNHAGGAAIEVDPRTFELLEAACGYCAASEGVFDITVGALSNLWDFKKERIPSPELRAQATAHVGWQKLVLQSRKDGRCFAQLTDRASQVDLGGIAKGWIADELGEALMLAGAAGAMLNLGGNVLVRGAKPDRSPWRIGIRNPLAQGPDATRHSVRLQNGSVVTSGVYERSFTRRGVRYHHILDPKTGMPISCDAISASVVAERSIDAEGYSTTLLALGPERARGFLRRHPEIIQTVFILQDGTVIPIAL